MAAHPSREMAPSSLETEVGTTGLAEVGSAMSGEPEALRRLWERHRRWVAAILLAYKPAHAELDDLLQDVAMTLVGKVHELRDESSIRAWLRAIAINAARAAARPGKNRPHLRLAGTDHPADKTEDTTAVVTEEAERMLELARQLPSTYSEPLLLRAVHGLSAQEVATILKLNEPTVHNRVSRARRMLRELAAASEQPVMTRASRAVSLGAGDGGAA